jgi:hypothetical protein
MSSLPEKVFTAQGTGARAPMPEALTLAQNEALTLAQNEALTPVQNETHTPLQNEALPLVKNEAPAEACSRCQACEEPGPVFECPECNSNVCGECYDIHQQAHWGDSDTRREQLAGISK